MSGYLRLTAEIAPDAVLPGDPGRALVLAQDLLVKPLMSNHNRGLWGYTGRTRAGRALTIQSTGIGGPSAAIVLEELASQGVTRAIRLGTGRALDSGLALGDAVVATRALADDGTSRALGAATAAHPDRDLTAALRRAAGPGARAGTLASVDLPYDPAAERPRAAWSAAGALVVELAAAPLLTLGPRLGVRVACAVVVAGTATPADDEAIAARTIGLGRAAAAALADAATLNGAQLSSPGATRPS